MHTRYSDGSGSVAEIAAAAAAAGLDYIVITDHRDLRALPERGRHGSVQVLVGYEHNDEYSHNHYLALGVRRVLPLDLPPAQVPARVRAEGGTGVIAHPDERRHRMTDLPPYPWTAWKADEFDAIELWNQMSEWTEGLTPANRFLRIWSPRKALRGPSDRLLYLWDILNTRRPVAGVAGVDAHAYPYRVGSLTIKVFPYKVQFRTLLTHFILDREPPEDTELFERALLAALRQCRIYFTSERWGATRGFDLTVESGGEKGTIGAKIAFAAGATLRAKWPLTARYGLYRNGFCFLRGRGRSLEAPLEAPGSYRLALFRRNRGWLFSNHVRLVDG
jgi:hypothetical protein